VCLSIVEVQIKSSGLVQDSPGLLEAWLEKTPIVGELIVIAENGLTDDFILLAFEANATTGLYPAGL
jgi:hypothetical protein